MPTKTFNFENVVIDLSKYTMVRVHNNGNYVYLQFLQQTNIKQQITVVEYPLTQFFADLQPPVIIVFIKFI